MNNLQSNDVISINFISEIDGYNFTLSSSTLKYEYNEILPPTDLVRVNAYGILRFIIKEKPKYYKQLSHNHLKEIKVNFNSKQDLTIDLKEVSNKKYIWLWEALKKDFG